MTAKRKICVVSSSRADYNHLHTLMSSIKKSRKLKLQIIVTGMHLLPEYGSTYKEISSDGFFIDGKIKSYQNNTNDSDILNSISHQIGNCSKVITKLKPDIIVLGKQKATILPWKIFMKVLEILWWKTQPLILKLGFTGKMYSEIINYHFSKRH